METATYRRRATVEAVQLTEEADWGEIAEWCGGELRNEMFSPGAEPETWLHIPGGHQGTTDDWVIRYATEDGPDFAIVCFDEFDDHFEMWPTGSHPPVTREWVADAITEAIIEHVWVRGTGEIDGDGVDMATDAVMALLAGGTNKADRWPDDDGHKIAHDPHPGGNTR